MTAVAQPAQQSGVPWWLVLIEGVALIILGILFLTNTVATTVIFIQVLGWYWLIRGIFYIIQIFLDSSMWGWKLAGGILGILAGIVVINHPLLSPLAVGSALVIILGVQGVIGGGIGVFQAFKGAGWGVGGTVWGAGCGVQGAGAVGPDGLQAAFVA